MPKLDDVLAGRTPAQRASIENQLYILGAHRANSFQAFGNLKTESRLPNEAWDELIDALLAARPDAVDIQRKLREVFRNWVLVGTEIPSLATKVFGRVVTLDAFISLLRKQFPGKPKEWSSKEVRDLLTKPFVLVRSRWAVRDLGKFLMWSTFNPKGSRPFLNFPTTADGLRRILGLDPSFRGKPILVLEYSLSTGMKPRFPTVADAYAGDEWPYFFRPAPEQASHGLIMCWPDYAKRTIPRPEVVHEVIKGCQLMQQPKRIK